MKSHYGLFEWEIGRKGCCDGKTEDRFFFPESNWTITIGITAGTPIYIGPSNIEHIKSRHPYEYEKYFPYISDIISAPSYVGKNPSDESITFVKFFQIGEEYVRVAVRVTTNGTAFAKTLHLLSTVNAERYIGKGTLKTLTNTPTEV